MARKRSTGHWLCPELQRPSEWGHLTVPELRLTVMVQKQRAAPDPPSKPHHVCHEHMAPIDSPESLLNTMLQSRSRKSCLDMPTALSICLGTATAWRSYQAKFSFSFCSAAPRGLEIACGVTTPDVRRTKPQTYRPELIIGRLYQPWAVNRLGIVPPSPAPPLAEVQGSQRIGNQRSMQESEEG